VSKGILAIIGHPDSMEILCAEGLTAETVKDVTAHGLTMVQKRSELQKSYSQAESALSKDFTRLVRNSACWDLVKWLFTFGMMILAFGLCKALTWKEQ
jgi:hypothetical protein